MLNISCYLQLTVFVSDKRRCGYKVSNNFRDLRHPSQR